MKLARVMFCALAVSAAGCEGRAAREARPAIAEIEPPPVRGRDGDITIGRAFEGASLRGRAGGPRDARGLADGCVGSIAEAGSVNHVLTVSEATPLTLKSSPIGVGFMDLALVVEHPSGEFTCADDSDSLDPVIAAVFEPGAHRIWVAVHTDASPPYSLTITPGVHTPDPIALGGRFAAPVVDGVPAEPIDEGTFGGLRVPAGVAQTSLEGRAGGTRRALDVGPGCAGWIAAVPDHVLIVEAPDELMLRVISDGDTTLTVQGPGGVVRCADDEDGLNPVIRDAFQPGRYSVYVGSYDAEDVPSYTLSVSR